MVVVKGFENILTIETDLKEDMIGEEAVQVGYKMETIVEQNAFRAQENAYDYCD